jgi:Fe/S biogenesis protein NfuA
MAQIAEQLAVVTVSPEARQVVCEALAQEHDPGGLALWLEVRGVQHAQFVYDLYFQARADAADDDAVVEDGELTVVVPKPSVDRLRGARLEWNAEGEGGLVLVNPNSPEPEELGVPEAVMAAGLDGPLGTRVRAVLEEMVNPSIAAHGGRADLVAIDESGGVAYLRLSGGCQGCAMSRMTLTQGIEAALREEVTEVTQVVDVTDHAGGANPYY